MTVSEYYDNMTPDEWKPILGPNLNFHLGFYRDGMSFEEGLEFATRRLFRYLTSGGRVLDLGCGWGGPALELTRHGYDVSCVTNSSAQQKYCTSLGLRTDILDVERDDLRDLGYFDSVLMMESLEHVVDKQELFRRLKHIAKRLVFVSNCDSQAVASPILTFGDTISMISAAELLRMLEVAGWHVELAVDSRKYSMPTFRYWQTRIETVYPTTRKRPLEMLYLLCLIALQDVGAFERRFPLLMVAAEAL